MPSIQDLVGLVARDDVPAPVAPATSVSSEANKVQTEQSNLNYAIIALALIFVGLLLVSSLIMLRRLKRQQQLRSANYAGLEAGLPAYNDVRPGTAGGVRPGSSRGHAHGFGGANHGFAAHHDHRNPRGLTIQTTAADGRRSCIVINRDGQPMLVNPNSPPHSPDNVPEIHITFPDEQDDQGRPKSGRVVVVRVGDNAAVGLEPLRDEQLPAYEKESRGQFYSIDMNAIGGLKEKDRSQFH